MESMNILYKEIESTNANMQPAYFQDLNLDQVIEAMIQKKDYLLPIFYSPLTKIENILYRQEVMKDVSSFSVRKILTEYSDEIFSHLRHLDNYWNSYEKREEKMKNFVEQIYFLDTAILYCEQTEKLKIALNQLDLNSEGMTLLKTYITDYLASEKFQVFKNTALAIQKNLNEIQFVLHKMGNTVQVRKFENDQDYMIDIKRIFERFLPEDFNFKEHPGYRFTPAEHVENGILRLASSYYRDTFNELKNFVLAYTNYPDQSIVDFTRDIQFYIEYQNFIGKFAFDEFPYCFPTILYKKSHIYQYDTFDVALAQNLLKKGKGIVANDYEFKEDERMIVVTGPNQGGKTTFARLIGQSNYLARLGGQVAGSSAQLFLVNSISTHFEKAESVVNLNGKLQNELIRMKEILMETNQTGLVIINEILSSTTLHDAELVGQKIIASLLGKDCYTVFVTFIDSLSRLDARQISMVSTVDSEDPTTRTFKLKRIPANGKAYAMQIAQKYHLTYAELVKAIHHES